MNKEKLIKKKKQQKTLNLSELITRHPRSRAIDQLAC